MLYSTSSLRETIQKTKTWRLHLVDQKLGKFTPRWAMPDGETSEKEDYCILSISGTQSDSDSTIVVLDKRSSRIIFYELRFCGLQFLDPIEVHDLYYNCKSSQNNMIDVLGVKYSPISKNIYYVASQESIVMYDQRMALNVRETYKAAIDKKTTKALSCFDINCNERLIAAGTEHIGGDAFILFWDTRYGKKKICSPMPSANFLGGYWESHTDDITWLAFHPTKEDTLASGSTDGLMNVFDLKQSSEDQALTYSLNTESSVDRLGWLTDKSLWCTTHTETLQLWDCEGASPYARVERNNLVMSQNENPDDCYVVNVHTSDTLGPFLLAGCSTTERQYLRCLFLKNNRLETCYNLVENKQVVRDSWFHEKSGSLVTAGEGDSLDVWNLNLFYIKLRSLQLK